ncbi:hypothetical protein L1887_54463 [Cichorium endivia]|nr:hypothetical protein L1887_54463 [Cichorium endivia]
MTTTQAYPELEEIPPAPRRSRVSSHAYPLIPQWVASVFATFPLHTFPLAKVYSPSVPATPTKPTLYVAPHLNRDGTFSATSDDDSSSHPGFIGDEKTLDQQTSGWSSSDPIALRWQMEFVFRQADVDVRFIDPSHNWGPAKSMPFLHLPPSHRSPSNSTASSVPTALLPAVDFAHHLDNYYPLSRPELGEKSANAWTDDATRLEARTWENLLQGRVMAGVLLAVLLSPQSSAYARAGSQPYLSSLLSTHLQNSFFDQQLRRISALNPSAAVAASASQPTTSLPGWEVGFLGWIGATHGFGHIRAGRRRPRLARRRRHTRCCICQPGGGSGQGGLRRCCRLAGTCGTHKGTARARVQGDATAARRVETDIARRIGFQHRPHRAHVGCDTTVPGRRR